MPQQVINNGESGLVVRTKLNQNFTELYAKVVGTANYIPKFATITTLGNSQMFDNGNSVGIGTATPIVGSKLDVSAPANSVGIISSTIGPMADGNHWFVRGVYTQTPQNMLDIGFHSTGANNPDYVFVSSPANLPLLLQSGGSVGIGTPTPFSKLSVQQTAGPIALSLGDAGNVNGKALDLGYDTVGDGGYIQAIHRGTAFKNLAINPSGGNVGIGIAAPIAITAGVTTLDIRGANGGGIALGVTGGSEGFIYTKANGLNIETVLKPLLFNTNGLERMRVQPDGNVGIGVLPTNPLSKLSVTGVVASNPTLGSPVGSIFSVLNDSNAYGLLVGVAGNGDSWIQAQRVDATATAYRLLLNPSGGNVGIGTLTPAQKLHVAGIIQIGTAALTGASTLYQNNIQTWDVGTDNFGNGTSNNQWYVYSGGVYRFTVQGGTGNVGIGTQQPQRKLHVVSDFLRLEGTSSGAANTWELRIRDLADGDFQLYSVTAAAIRFYIYSNGTVRIPQLAGAGTVPLMVLADGTLSR